MTFHECLTLQPTGDKLPLLGITTEDNVPEDVERIIYDSIKQGYRLIITIFNDGKEAEIGKGVRRAITDGIVKREELFIVGQLWSSYRQKQHIKPVLQMTLDNLGLDYIDLYLVQFPFATEYIDPKQFSHEREETNKLKLVSFSLEESWRELEALVDAGLIRNLGISHFNFQSVVDLLRYARIRPSVLEIEHHPYFQQESLVEWVRSKGMQVMAYAPLGSISYYYNLQDLAMNPVVGKIADKHQIREREVVLAWTVRRQVVFITDAHNTYFTKTYVNVDQVELDDDDMRDIDKLEANARFYHFSVNVDGNILPVF